MTYREVFKADKRENEKDLYQVHFYQEGLWWKAWEWSVYLYDNFMSRLMSNENKKVLNILKRMTVQNSEGSIVIIGFPVEAFDNFLPDINKRFKIISDTEIVYDLSKHDEVVKSMMDFGIMVDNYEDILSEWKYEIPFTEETIHRKRNGKYIVSEKEDTDVMFMDCNIQVQHEDIQNEIKTSIVYKDVNDIVNRIRNYPIEFRTPLDNTNFLFELKKALLEIK